MRRHSLLAWAMTLAALTPLTARTAQSPTRPNVLILFTDDQRADTLSAYGNRHIRTPNLDRLIHGGYSFRRNYCFGSNNGAVCVPSRAMLNTGRNWFQVNAQLTGSRLMPEVFGENGYRTFATGKWHNGEPSFLRGFQRGESVFFGGMADHTQVPIRDVTPAHTLTPVRIGAKPSSELFADAALKFLKAQDGNQPFYCYVAFTAPHDPRQPQPPFDREYAAKKPPLPKNFMPQHPFDNDNLVLRDEMLAPWPRPAAMIREQLAEYYGLIAHLDGQIGRILDHLKASGLDKNTIIVYAADHGLALGSHGLLGKQSVYEHSMRSPLVFSGPGVPANLETRAYSYLLDVFPTLCDLTGVPAPDGVFGKSLRPIWESRAESVRDSCFLPFQNSMRAVSDGRWKLIRYPQVDRTQLFDLRSDPDELRDRSAEARQAERIAALRKRLEEWQSLVGDRQPWSVPNPRPAAIDLTGRKRSPDQWQPEWIRKKYFEGVEN